MDATTVKTHVINNSGSPFVDMVWFCGNLKKNITNKKHMFKRTQAFLQPLCVDSVFTRPVRVNIKLKFRNCVMEVYVTLCVYINVDSLYTKWQHNK